MRKCVNGVAVDMTPQEEAAFEASRTPTLPEAKRAAREALAVRLVQAEQAGFVFQTGRVASDSAMLSRIAVLALRAERALRDAELINVRIADDNGGTFALNRGEMLDLAKAAGDHFIACSANARAIRQAIQAATTLAEVAAVDINAGWPV